MTERRRAPLSPEAAAIVRAQRAAGRLSHGPSRRNVLAGAGAAGLVAALSACGTGTSSGSDAGPSPAADTSDADKVVNWANWTLYLDYDDKTKTYPTLEKFEKTAGIKATYDEASRVIRQGYVQLLDHAVIPHWENLLDTLKNVSFDPGRKHSLTWQSGYAGIAYNKKKWTGPKPTKISDLWAKGVHGKVEVLSEMRDTMGLIMLEQGVDISNSFTSDQFGKALDVLETQLSSGQIRQVKGNSYKEDLISGDAVACIAWSGDITQLNFENDDQWEFVIPEAGCTLWSDNMLVPIGSPHKKNAEILMNYYYDPKVAAEVAAYVNYICPVKGAQDELAKTDPELAENAYIFPTQEDLAKAHVFRTLSPAEETQFSTDFQKVLGV
jgi:spermidine/putrescine transport system substrate-binding protein